MVVAEWGKQRLERLCAHFPALWLYHVDGCGLLSALASLLSTFTARREPPQPLGTTCSRGLPSKEGRHDRESGQQFCSQMSPDSEQKRP